MKIGKHSERISNNARTEKNDKKNTMLVVGLSIVAILLVVWTFALAKKAEETVSVVMFTQDVYKNTVITEDMLVEYQMNKSEFEKYAVTEENGTVKRRILLWSEKDMVIGSFAAYPLQENTVAMYRDFLTSRIDNSDSVLYSYPGKVIVRLEVDSSDLDAYKTFLEPGDRVNIDAIYTSTASLQESDGTNTTVDTVKVDTIFKDIIVADLLNSDGDSILDIYESYNDMTVYEQAEMDSDEDFQSSVTPQYLLVALTPEEVSQYQKYTSMDCSYSMTLPQREN